MTLLTYPTSLYRVPRHVVAWKKLNYQLSEEPKPGQKDTTRTQPNGDGDEDHSDTDDFGFERPTFDGDKPSVAKYLKPDTGPCRFRSILFVSSGARIRDGRCLLFRALF